MDDHTFARRIEAEDQNAIRTFLAEHYDSVLRFQRHLTRCEEDAEDLTQATFLKAKRNIGSFRGASSLRTWLHKVAFREYTHWRRTQRLWPMLRWETGAVDPHFTSVDDGLLLLDALHRIPPAMREAFLLFAVQELSLEETAAVLGVPPGTVKSRLYHARARLRTLIEAEQEMPLGEPAYENH